MAIQIKKAVKFGAKLRLALYGPSGSGKTYTALAIAREMAGDKRVCVIDTERGSASKYADVFDFDVIELDTFHPNSYIDALRAVVQAKAYSVVVIDSASHEWEGSKGALELAGRDFTNWANVTPLHNRFIDAMLSADIHVIATMRAKEEHVMEQKEVQGKIKNVVSKKGMEPIQRKGMQYEFDIVAALAMDNVLSIEKTRCSALKDMDYHPGNECSFAEVVKVWLDGVQAPERPTMPPLPQQANHSPQPPQATPAPSQAQQNALVQEVATEKQVLSIRKLCEHLGKPEPEGLEAMSYASAKTLIEGLTQEYRQSRSQAQAPAPVPVQAQPTPDIAALQKLCHEVLGPGRWAYAKEKLLGKNLPDKDVTEAHRVVLYNRLMEHAARKQGNGSEAA